ncbi:MAG: hypothetical protein H0U76_07020 [Ktedonobacteraceae bacterium]|nr:hypothetical protein [Ktedonobacteraceae bacterium]
MRFGNKRCEQFQSFLPEMILDSNDAQANVPADVWQHLVECSPCRTNLQELQATMQLLDPWQVPEPSAYFDTRMAARLREEKNSPAPGWMERLRTRLLFDSNLQLRPAMTAAFALLLIVGAGSYEGFVSFNHTQPARVTVSATVTDLERLDSNEKTLQQLAAFDDSDASVGQNSQSSTSN